MSESFDSVLLIAFGGPTRPEEIRPFLENVTRGRRIPPDRLESVAHHYELIGGRSPLNEITMRQAKGLEERLRERGTPLPVYVGMRNWHPYLHETLAEMAAAGCKRTLGIILSAQQNEAGWGRYQVDVAEARAKVGESAPEVIYADEWHAHPLFLEAVADGVRQQLDALTPERRAAAKLIFTAHSIPVSMAGDSPYVEQVRDGAERVAALVGHSNWMIAYQSRSGSPRDPWLEPDICDVVRSLAAEGVQDIVASPIGFICDHAEVLYDLDIEAKQIADEVGVGFHRAATVNDHPAFIEMLGSLSGQTSPTSPTSQTSQTPLTPQTIVVIGGGIAGLAAAHRLVELRREHEAPVEVLLLEAENRLGGVMGSDYRDGFVLEWGPDSFISEKPWAFKLSERVGLTPHLVRTNDEHRRNFVVYDGKLHALPDGFLMMAPTKFWPLVETRLFSWPGKMRMALDLVLPRGTERPDESLGSFVTRRLGREALERVVQPLVGGIYTANPDDLSLAATMPRFLEMERKERSVIWAMWNQMRRMNAAANANTRPTSGARWSLFVSVDRGMQGLVDAVAAHIPERSVRLGCAVKNVARVEGTPRAWRVETSKGDVIEADAVILATPSHQSAAMVEGVDPALAREMRGVGYASSATVSLAFRRDQIADPLDGFGFVVPFVERRSIIACTYSSVKYPGRAPENHVLLRAFVGGSMQEELALQEDDRLVANVRRELRELLGISAEPLFTNIHRHHKAMPQYRVGHLYLLARLDARLAALPGLAVAGNAYRGVGVPDCIHSGEDAAESVFGAIGAKRA